jgi:asparagine synthase (glutamine-hydrolysing)
MGNFLAVIPSKDFQYEGRHLFQAGLKISRRIKSQTPSNIVETQWACAASFHRKNGSGGSLVIDSETDSWLVAIGTWFHESGYGSGAEYRLLKDYLAVGPMRLATELEGFFILVIGDAGKQETVVITDLIASCHCYVRSCKNAIALSSSSLLLAALEDYNLDPVGCQEFICTGTIYENRTFYREVSKLGPATVFRFRDGKLTENRRYWEISNVEPEPLDDQFAVRTLWETLLSAAQKVGSVYRNPVCDLTGGYDSRVLVAAFLTEGIRFSTTVTGFPDNPDVLVANQVAGVTGIPHLHLLVDEPILFEQAAETLCFTDGEFDLFEYARILRVHETLSQQFDISINGSFGGIARALWWELLFPRIGARRTLDAEKLARNRYAPRSFDASLFPPEIRLHFVSHFAGVIERVNAGLSSLPNTMQMDHANLMMRIRRWQGRIASSTNQLWPCLSPFGIRSVLEVVLRTSPKLRLRSLLVRRILTEYQPSLAEIPLDRGYPPLPAALSNIHRFWPLLKYYQRRILSKLDRMLNRHPRRQSSTQGHFSAGIGIWDQEAIRELLSPTSMRLGCFIDTSALAAFLDRSKSQEFPFGGQLSKVLTLEHSLKTLESVKGE